MKSMSTPKSMFVVEFPLKVQLFQKHIIDKRLEIARNIYNSLLTMTYKRYKSMVALEAYRAALQELATDKEAAKQKLAEFRKEFRLGEFDFYSDVKYMRHHFKENIDSGVAQSIAKHLWRGYEKKLFGAGKKLHYKKFGEMNTLEGTTNKSGLKFRDGRVVWFGLDIPVEIDHRNIYELEALKHDIVLCRIVRRAIRGKYKYYTQIVFRGIPPRKAGHTIGEGDVVLTFNDDSTSVEVETVSHMLEYPLAGRVADIKEQQAELQRKLERSRRAMNPDNYNEDGTIKKRVSWVRSKRYVKTLMELKEINRKQTAIKKQQYEELANEIIKLGDSFLVKKPDDSDLPSGFLTILDRKLKVYGKQLVYERVEAWNW